MMGQPTLIGMMLNEGDSVAPYWDPVKGVDRDIADFITMDSFACNVALEAGYAPFVYTNPVLFLD